MAPNPNGEVAFYSDESQFQAGHSTMKCGWYAVYQNHFAGQHAPGGSGADIEKAADAAYVAADGPDVSSNQSGMSLPQLYAAIQKAGNHWQNLYPDSLSLKQADLKALIRGWLKLEYPIIVAVDEATIHDMDLNANPYSWNPQPGQYTHIITLSGLQPNGIDFLCRDTASIAPTGVRPGPRRYASTPMELISATIFVLPWLQRPASANLPAAAPAPTPATNWKQQAQTALAALQDALAHLS